MRSAFRAHPGSKSFVEPKIVPPRHRHQVAKPLMSGLVRNHFINALPRCGGRFLGIKEQSRFVIGNPAPVLHRATEATGNGDLIEFRQRIGNAEVIVVIFENLRSAFERVAAPFCFPLGGDNTNLRAGCCHFNEIEFARDENIQVTRHRWRCGETHFFAARPDYFRVVDLCLGFDRHIGNREPVLGHDGGELKARSETGFIPTWEKSAGIGRFELRAERYLFRVGPLFLIPHIKKSLALLVDFARKAKGQRVIAGRKFGWQCQREQFVALVDLNGGLGQLLIIDRCACNFEFKRVQNELPNPRMHIQFHRFASGKR